MYSNGVQHGVVGSAGGNKALLYSELGTAALLTDIMTLPQLSVPVAV
jgi:hypothetical protein